MLLAATISGVGRQTISLLLMNRSPLRANTRFIGGVSYQVTPQLRLLGDVDWLTYQNGSPSAAAEAGRAQALFQAQFTY